MLVYLCIAKLITLVNIDNQYVIAENMKPLSEREKEIMEILWAHGPMFVKEIIDCFPDPKPHFNTVSTFVRILEKKGFVSHEKLGNSYRYSPAFKREDMRTAELDAVIENTYGGNAKEAVSDILRSGKLTDDDIWDLMDAFKDSLRRR